MDEVIERITQFINLEQYDNARFAANKLTDDAERQYQLQRIDINEKYIRRGKYREAGIAYWELGRTQEAKEQFKLSKDDILIELVDACSIDDNKGLDIDILQFYPRCGKQRSGKESHTADFAKRFNLAERQAKRN